MEGIKDTSTLTFRKILGNGLSYEVPKFQRDYSWEFEHWDDIWHDLEDLYNDREKSHYMGYLVLQTSNYKLHKIIDGQQRLATISILIVAVLKHLKRLEEEKIDLEKNKIRREQLQNSYIGTLDPVTLIAYNKLVLNRNNDNFYKHYIVTLRNIEKIRNLNKSEKLLRHSFEYFFEKMSKYKTGEELTTFIDKIVDKLFFTVITVGDELNAYKVFETLNARGVQLSSADLLKNYLFSTVDGNSHESEIKYLETMWEKIVLNLRNKKIQEFLRIYWNSKNKLVREKDLFKEIRNNIKSKEKVFELIRDLDEKSDIYMALLNPDDELWNGNREIKKSLRELKIFGAKQPLSLLLSAYCHLNLDNFIKILKICSIIYFRANVICGLNPNEQERIFNRVAIDINNNKTFNVLDFKKIYPNDQIFQKSFSIKELNDTPRNRKLIKYILIHLEKVFSNTDYDLDSDKNTIEHILPKVPDINWDLEDGIIEKYIYYLGNMCLLEKSKNEKSNNEVFQKKKEIFKNSDFISTKLIAQNYENWNEESIIFRQNEMAECALNIWKIDLLS